MENSEHYQLVADALQWVAENQAEQPDLETLAAEMGISPHHLQRVFQAWAGVIPKQFLKSLTRKAAHDRLDCGNTVQDAALSSGRSGPGRLHDLMITTEALTPGEVKKRGLGVQIEYGHGQSPFGRALIAWTPRGINFLGFCDDQENGQIFRDLQNRWKNADFRENPAAAQDWLNAIFSDTAGTPIPIWLRGSPFQLKVWEALLAIPEGTHATYGRIASQLGNPGASRAVGTAVGSNPVAWIIPCHRVIRQLGELGGYHWGEVRKQAMIGFEANRSNPLAA